MNNILFNIYLKTNRLAKISVQNLTDEQVNVIMSGNYIDQLSNEQLSTINLDELVNKYDSDSKEYVGLMKALLKLNRQDIMEKKYYLYYQICSCPEISLEEKWKLFSENYENRKFDRKDAITSISRNNEKELIERLEEDKDFATAFLKEVGNSSELIKFPMDVKKLICSDRNFQENFVNPKFLCNGPNGRIFEIYKNLPEDKKHLLAFFYYEGNSSRSTDEAKFSELFHEKYGEILDESEINELMSLRENYDRSSEANAVENQRNKEYELVSNILKELSNNPNYYREIKAISEKFCNGDIKKAAFFSQRYKNEQIRQEMLSASDQLSQEELQN